MSSETNPTPPAATPRGLDALIWANPSPFTRWLGRWRHVFFILLVLFILIPFNGQWRLGLDSSIYRGVAQSLATGHGYTFAGRAQTQVYPGLPFLLAGLQKITGSASVIPPLIVMNAAWCMVFGYGYLTLVVVLLLPLSILLARIFAVT